MNISENSYSLKSSCLNKEELLERRKSEKKAIIFGIIAQFIWAVNNIQLKTYKQLFPDSYGKNNLVFWRSLPIMIAGYIHS